MRTDMSCDYLSLISSYNRNISDKIVAKIKTNILCSINCFQLSYRLRDNVGKCGRAGQATGDNVAHAHCMLDT